MPETVTLKDGTLVQLRPIRPDDALRLKALFRRLSPESVYLRFLDHRRELPDADAARFATVDYQSQMAIVATLEENAEEVIIGVGRYAVVVPEEPEKAESAITVEDRYQGRGLGLILADRLVAYARAHGIRAFLAEVSVANTRMMQFIRRSGLPVKRKLDSGVWELQVELENKSEESVRPSPAPPDMPRLPGQAAPRPPASRNLSNL